MRTRAPPAPAKGWPPPRDGAHAAVPNLSARAGREIPDRVAKGVGRASSWSPRGRSWGRGRPKGQCAPPQCFASRSTRSDPPGSVCPPPRSPIRPRSRGARVAGPAAGCHGPDAPRSANARPWPQPRPVLGPRADRFAPRTPLWHRAGSRRRRARQSRFQPQDRSGADGRVSRSLPDA